MHLLCRGASNITTFIILFLLKILLISIQLLITFPIIRAVWKSVMHLNVLLCVEFLFNYNLATTTFHSLYSSWLYQFICSSLCHVLSSIRSRRKMLEKSVLFRSIQHFSSNSSSNRLQSHPWSILSLLHFIVSKKIFFVTSYFEFQNLLHWNRSVLCLNSLVLVSCTNCFRK